MPDQKLSELSDLDIALADYLYSALAGSPSGFGKVSAARALGNLGIVPGGRLTLTTAVPVTTADVTAAGTLFYTPFLHNLIRVWDGTRWLYKAFAEISLSLTLTSGKNYDVFVDDDAATLSLSAAWTNDTTRAEALGTQNSVTVLNSDKTKLWLGTIRASGTNTTEDSGGGVTTQVGGKRFVWNAYNQVSRWLRVIDTANTWTYSTGAWRVADGATAPLNCVEWVCGLAGSAASLRLLAGLNLSVSSGRACRSGMGFNSVTATTGLAPFIYIMTAAAVTQVFHASFFSGYQVLGYNYASWLEYGGDGVPVWQGDAAAAGQSGLDGTIQS